MRGLLAASLSGVLLFGAAPDRAVSADVEDSLTITQADDAELNAAERRAQETLPIFWQKFDAAPAGYEAFAVKVGMPANGGGVEHIWVDDLVRPDKGKIRGRLANEPYALPGMSAGSKVRFDPGQISDWQYATAGKLYGHFTTRVLMARASEEERAPMLDLLSPAPLESEAN